MGVYGETLFIFKSCLNSHIRNHIPSPSLKCEQTVMIKLTTHSNDMCRTKYKMSPSSVRSEGGEAAAGYCLNSVSYRVDEAVKYNVLNSD